MRVEVAGDGSTRRSGLFRRRSKTAAPTIVLEDETTTDNVESDQPIMEMHAVPRDEVLAVIDELGGVVAAVDRNTNAPPWESYTYYAAKPATRSRNSL